MKEVNECIFCRSCGVFNTVEHIIPESLGNTEDTIEGAVCDACQNYLAREVEKVALEKTSLAFWRTFLGTTTKRGKLPSVSLTPPTGGRVPAAHPHTDALGFTAHADGTTSVDIESPKTAAVIRDSDRGNFKLVLAPFHLSALGRLSGKIGLELLAKHNLHQALHVRYDELRSFVRFGTTSRLWALYWGIQGELSDSKDIVKRENGWFVEHECYRYALGKTIGDEHVFAFGIGTDMWVISLANRLPQCEVESSIEGVPMTCIFYPDGSW
jgi:hypothetical protein